jgi:hypothetical protein
MPPYVDGAQSRLSVTAVAEGLAFFSDHILWRVNANLWLKITGRKGIVVPRCTLLGVSIVLPFDWPRFSAGPFFLSTGPVSQRGHFLERILSRVNANLWLKITEKGSLSLEARCCV